MPEDIEAMKDNNAEIFTVLIQIMLSLQKDAMEFERKQAGRMITFQQYRYCSVLGVSIQSQSKPLSL